MRATRIWLCAVLALALIACGKGTTEPGDVSPADLVGRYGAVTLTTTERGVVRDRLDEGAFIDLRLQVDGTTSGEFFLPESGGVSQDLVGTYLLDEARSEVMLRHDADTFLRDLSWLATRSANGIRMEAEGAFGETTVRVALIETGG